MWLDKFRFHIPATYDGTTDPREFLQIYSTAMVADRADDKVMANLFPLAIFDATRPWLMHLPRNSVASWADLCEQFVGAFQGGYRRLGTLTDLQHVHQKPGDPPVVHRALLQGGSSHS